MFVYICNMKEIKLTKGMVAIVDDSDYDELSKYKWHVSVTGSKTRRYYAMRTVKGKNCSMHRFICSEVGKWTDHINRNTLDNRRCNLRVCTPSENLSNKASYGTSGYLGVNCIKGKYWRAEIRKDGVKKYLGIYKTKELAAKAYNDAAILIHGEFANLNVIL